MATVTGTRRLLDISGNNISTAVSLEAEGTLLDVNGAAGASGQVLSSIGSGVDWVDASSVIGGPYLPLSAGSSYPLTGALHFGDAFNYIEKNASSDMLMVANRHITFSDVISGVVNERMRIEEGGNVGIGTTNPGYTLDVNGSIHSTNITIADAIYHEGDTNNYMQFHTNDQWRVVTGGAERLEVNNTQVTVANNLQVNGSIYTSQYIYHTGDIDTYMRFPSNDTISWNTAGSERMRISSTGNVGIGTTSPSNKLSLAGSGQNWTTSPGIKMWDSFNSKGWYVGSANNHTIGDFYIRSVTAENLYPVSANQQFTIKQSGNVGIGTISPGSKLHVSGGDIQLDDGYEVQFNVTGTVTAEEELVLDAGNTDSKIILEGADSAMKFITGNSTAIAINDSQNVGIGTTSPANKLDVVGISRFTHSSSTAYRGAIETVTDNAYPTWDIGWLHARTTSSTYGNIARFNNQSGTQIGGIFYSGSSGTSFVTTSDYRLKENIKEISDSISRVKKLKPCRFNFAAEKNKVIDGFIAHEVQEVVPEAVHGEKDALQKDGSIDAQTLEVSRLIPVLTKALQEAINKIEELELRIQTIENN